MERLAREPRNFKECVEADLRRAARLIIKIQDELDPQFRIATPEGDFWIALTLPPDRPLLSCGKPMRRLASLAS